MSYEQYITQKLSRVPPTGINDGFVIPTSLFPHQSALTAWALRRGRCAIFADTGLGKSRMQLAWADAVHRHTKRPVLILAPLAVASQTVLEGQSLSLGIALCREAADAGQESTSPTMTGCTSWKDPVTAMQRTKALGLLHKSVRENSAMCRQGIPDYLITVRTPGEQEDRVTHGAEYPVDLWQKVASPVWMDINPSKTLQYMSAREHDDERHICPLQLEVIERGVMLWTNPGDIVLSPFMGIGSEGYAALEMGRRFVGAELKASYYQQAVANLAAAIAKTDDLFAEVA